jgi:hypothetical protein
MIFILTEEWVFLFFHACVRRHDKICKYVQNFLAVTNFVILKLYAAWMAVFNISSPGLWGKANMCCCPLIPFLGKLSTRIYEVPFVSYRCAHLIRASSIHVPRLVAGWCASLQFLHFAVCFLPPSYLCPCSSRSLPRLLWVSSGSLSKWVALTDYYDFKIPRLSVVVP